MQRRRRLRRGGCNSSAYLTLKKDLREANLQSLGGSSSFLPSSNLDSDPLLSSFIFNSPPAHEFAVPITKGDSVDKVSPIDTPKRYTNPVLYSKEIRCFAFVLHVRDSVFLIHLQRYSTSISF